MVVTAKKPGTSSLIVWDESGASQAFMVTSDLNIDTLKDAMKQAYPNENITVTGNEGRIVLTGITGTDKVSDGALKMAAQYSKDVTSAVVVNSSTVKQVTLKVRIVEIDRSKLNAFAVNLFNQGGSNLIGSTTGQASSTVTVTPATATTPKSVSVTNPLNFVLYSFGHNVGATIQDLETMGCLQILSEPNITAMSGEKGSFLAGGEFPFPVVQGGAGGLTSITIQFRPYGVKLEFTPTVNTDGTVSSSRSRPRSAHSTTPTRFRSAATPSPRSPRARQRPRLFFAAAKPLPSPACSTSVPPTSSPTLPASPAFPFLDSSSNQRM